MPISEHFERMREQHGNEAFRLAPTLFWIHHGDTAITIACLLGTILSVLLMIGVSTRMVIGLLWLDYLSLSVAGQQFFYYQWDTLLLETLVFSFFLAPCHFWPRRGDHSKEISRLAIWALWFLAIKLTFLSGATKWLSGDLSWRDLSALHFHFFTQPLPNPASWIAAQMPDWFLKAGIIATLVIELVAPLFVFFVPRRIRHLACFAMIGLQIIIMATGNYGFFNLLTITLYVLMVDDRFFRAAISIIRKALRRGSTNSVAGNVSDENRWHWTLWSITRSTSLPVLLFISTLTFVNEIVRTSDKPSLSKPLVWVVDRLDQYVDSWARPGVLKWTHPFNSVSGYGLFRIMTKERPEIIFEVSSDGETWRELEFRYKPGDLGRRPPILFGHMPRLDWQLWFSALYWRHESVTNEYIQHVLMKRLTEDVDALQRLVGPQSSDEEIVAIRRVLYLYEFDYDEDSSHWWKRTKVDQTTIFR